MYLFFIYYVYFLIFNYWHWGEGEQLITRRGRNPLGSAKVGLCRDASPRRTQALARKDNPLFFHQCKLFQSGNFRFYQLSGIRVVYFIVSK